MHVLESMPPDVQEILGKRICDLGLRLEGSPLEPFVQQLYRELERKGLQKFRPGVYLTDEWGCPSGEPVIGIPFYLADPRLARIEREVNDLESEREIMMYLRHEAGHAFNYAYELYKTPQWREVFGPYRKAYRDNYRPVPFSRLYVRHIEGWYAQKHPDEDFSETFAVWLTPKSGWRKRYRGWGALQKLKYMNRVARRVAQADPVRRKGRTDITVDQIESTVGEFYRARTEESSTADLALDTDLADIFNTSKRRRIRVLPAGDLIASQRKTLVDKITYWSGVRREIIRRLVQQIEGRVRALDLRADATRQAEQLTELTVYATALAMTYLARGRFE